MPYTVKSWCIHPSHDAIDPISGKHLFVKGGPKPTHPIGIHRISAFVANAINQQYSLFNDSTSKKVSEGDKICTNCLRGISKDEFINGIYADYADEDMSIDGKEWITVDDNKDFVQVKNEDEELPSSQEQKHAKEEAKRKLNIIFDLLNIPTIRDLRRSRNIRENVNTACSNLHALCDSLLDTEFEPVNNNLSTNDANALLSGLKMLFQESSEDEQIRLLTISPANWGRCMIQNWFNCSSYQARQALLLKQNQGVLAFPKYQSGNKPLPDSTIKLVIEFYFQDGISRASSRKKDVIHINKQPIPVRFLEMTGREAYQQFINENPNVDISKSSFYALRPREVKWDVPLETCLCFYHENMQLLLKSWNRFLKNNIVDPSTNNFELITDKYLIERIVCGIPGEDCFTRHCATCSTMNPSDILVDNININFDDNISWSQWKTSNNKVDLQHINGSVDSFLSEIDSQWEAFLLHWHITKEQRDYIKILRLNSNSNTYILIQLDFAENFKIFQQREVQGCHWNNHQVTIFTIHLKIGHENKNIVIISDHMSHNTSFVYVVQEIIVTFIKKHFPTVNKINYLSDGASSQFKNNFNMFNLIYHKEDFGLEGCWTFTSTAHGKGPCDGLGASVKSTATRHIISSGISIASAEDFYEFTKKFNEDAANMSTNNQPPIHTFFIKSTTVENVYNKVLKPRWDKLHRTNRIKHLRSFHQFDIRSDQTIIYKRTSTSIDYNTFMFPNNDDIHSSVQHVNLSADINIGVYVIIDLNDTFHLAKIKMVNHLTQEIEACYFEPAFPATIFYVSRSKNKKNFKTKIQDILLFLRQDLVVGKHNEVYLNDKQFRDIDNTVKPLLVNTSIW